MQRAYQVWCALLFDPIAVLQKWRGVPTYLHNLFKYLRSARGGGFAVRWTALYPCLSDRYAKATSLRGHYFHQDLWAARQLYTLGVRHHIDIGSRVDGFIAHILPFCAVTYVDIRALDVKSDGLEYVSASISALPFASDSVRSLSSLSVLEHIGLGRYGDEVDPEGWRLASRELSRVLQPKGLLLISVPVGYQQVMFDAHRIFAPETLCAAFPSLELVSFALVDDEASCIRTDATFDDAWNCRFGCGLFAFRKN